MTDDTRDALDAAAMTADTPIDAATLDELRSQKQAGTNWYSGYAVLSLVALIDQQAARIAELEAERAGWVVPAVLKP